MTAELQIVGATKMMAAARYHAALTDGLVLAGSRSLRDGPTAGELALEGEYNRAAQPALAELYARPIVAGLGAMMGLSEAEIVRWVLDYYGEERAAVERLGEVYQGFGRRAFNLGGQMGLEELGLFGRFEATDGWVLDEIDAQTARLTDLRRGARLSTVVTTAEEIGREVNRRREEGIEAVDLLPLLSAWALGRMVIRTAMIAATESVRMTRWGMVWAFAGNGVEGVRHVCEPDVDDRCSGKVCPSLCGTEYRLGGVFHPMREIPSAGLIPLHSRCRCWYEPLMDGWLKPALIWTGFALELLADNE